jgi:hypothetical protein
VAVYQPVIKKAGKDTGRGTGPLPSDGVQLLDNGGEKSVDFLGDINTKYDVDVRGGMLVVTPKPGFVAGDSIMLCDSRWSASDQTPIRFSVFGTTYTIGGTTNQYVDLVIPGVSSVLAYRGAALGFVREG